MNKTSKKISVKQFLMKSGRFENADECLNSVRDGRVSINDDAIINPKFFFDTKNAIVKLDGEKIKKVGGLYFLLNKPKGFLSQKYAQKNDYEKTIYDLIENLGLKKEQAKSLFAVGRLDKDTEGLMILTNDGKLSSMAMYPKNKIQKRYRAALEKPIDQKTARSMEKGVEIGIDGGKYKTRPCKIKPVGEALAYICITEGKKRQIRKMFEACGNKVLNLKRISIGGLELGNLETGQFKSLSREEIMRKLFQ